MIFLLLALKKQKLTFSFSRKQQQTKKIMPSLASHEELISESEILQ